MFNLMTLFGVRSFNRKDSAFVINGFLLVGWINGQKSVLIFTIGTLVEIVEIISVFGQHFIRIVQFSKFCGCLSFIKN